MLGHDTSRGWGGGGAEGGSSDWQPHRGGNRLFRPQEGGQTFWGLPGAADEQDIGTEGRRDGQIGEGIIQRVEEGSTAVPLADKDAAEALGDECLASVGNVEIHQGSVGI